MALPVLVYKNIEKEPKIKFNRSHIYPKHRLATYQDEDVNYSSYAP